MESRKKEENLKEMKPTFDKKESRNESKAFKRPRQSVQSVGRKQSKPNHLKKNTIISESLHVPKAKRTSKNRRNKSRDSVVSAIFETPDGEKDKDKDTGAKSKQIRLHSIIPKRVTDLSSALLKKKPSVTAGAGTHGNHIHRGQGVATNSKILEILSSEDSYGSSLYSDLSKSNIHIYKEASILQIPRKIRVKIWNLASMNANLQLRLTCKILKTDIDEFVGVSAELDEKDESFPYLIKLGIRKATIINMTSSRGDFLRRPNLLKELWITGNIRSLTFSRLLVECENITHLSIQFSKELFSTKPKLFPIFATPPNQDQRTFKIFPQLRFIRLQATTKSDLDLAYVTNTFTGLINSHLLNQVHLREIYVSIVHKFTHDLIGVCSQLMSVLVCDNCDSLEDLFMEIKFQHVPNPLGDEGFSNNKEYNNVGFGGIPLGYYSSSHFIIENCEEPKHPPWTDFTHLKKLHFSSGMAEFSCFWESIMEKINALEILFCEIPSPLSWIYYKQFIEGCENTIQSVTLNSIDYHGSVTKSLDINLSIFHRCKRLHLLCLNQTKHPSMKSPKLLNVSKLPSSLEVVEFAWLSMSTTQAFRLFRFSRISQLRLAYWSTTDSSFGAFLWLAGWGYSLGCTNLRELIVVDLKIRFQNNKKRIVSLVKHKKVLGTYLDYNETQLALRKNTYVK